MDSYLDFYSDLYIFVFPDEETIVNVYTALCTEAGTEPAWSGLCYYLGFDTSGDQAAIGEAVHSAIAVTQGLQYESLSYATSAAAETDFFSAYGGLFFLGVFLGAVFIMATVLIMYYKQVSEGYDDKVRFEIMQNIGMSKSEVRRSIRSQVLIVFFLPLTTAVIHVLFAFPMIRRLLLVMNFTNTTLYLLCTLGTVVAFSLLYTAVYSFTAKTYYKIVQQ